MPIISMHEHHTYLRAAGVIDIKLSAAAAELDAPEGHLHQSVSLAATASPAPHASSDNGTQVRRIVPAVGRRHVPLCDNALRTPGNSLRGSAAVGTKAFRDPAVCSRRKPSLQRSIRL